MEMEEFELKMARLRRARSSAVATIIAVPLLALLLAPIAFFVITGAEYLTAWSKPLGMLLFCVLAGRAMFGGSVMAIGYYALAWLVAVILLCASHYYLGAELTHALGFAFSGLLLAGPVMYVLVRFLVDELKSPSCAKSAPIGFDRAAGMHAFLELRMRCCHQLACCKLT